MKATMISKARDYTDLGIRSAIEETQASEVKIEKTIILSDKEFKNFVNYFLADRKIIEDNIKSMYVDDDGVWHCLKVTSKNADYSVLVESEGFSYARYTAIVMKRKDN